MVLSSALPTEASVLKSASDDAGFLRKTRSCDYKSSGNQMEARKVVCFSDFDGTMFLQDTGHILFDTHGCGPVRRKELSGAIRSGRSPFTEGQNAMWGSLNVPFEVGFELMRTQLRIDPGFLDFYAFCAEKSIPFHVMSSGMEPILKRVMELYLGKDEASRLQILANGLEVSEDGSVWKPIWRHESDLGHDKAKSITDYRKYTAAHSEDGTSPLIVFLGDGVSDLAAAREADLLFARRGLQLESYCIEHKIHYFPFDSFRDIQDVMSKFICGLSLPLPQLMEDVITHPMPPLALPLKIDVSKERATAVATHHRGLPRRRLSLITAN